MHRDSVSFRKQFDEAYGKYVVRGGFFESSDYYIQEKPRYWRSLKILSGLQLPRPASILEIGGGQIALMRHLLCEDDCTVADASRAYSKHLEDLGIHAFKFDLLRDEPTTGFLNRFDAVVLLEVIEHIPTPPYLIFQKLIKFLRPNGVLFVTTPNLFRIRNAIMLVFGRDFLDRFLLPAPGQSAGHQLEYSAEHLRWQLEKGGFLVERVFHDTLGRTGHSFGARLAHWMSIPLDLRPKWRKGLVAIARKSENIEP